MGRIRSVHPEQWTDEQYLSCSIPARLFAIALRNVSDCNGVFEWNPLKLKIQLFPVDAVDLPSLLAELSENAIVKKYTVDGKPYGAIRNFKKYQTPNNPSGKYPSPEKADWSATETLQYFYGNSTKEVQDSWYIGSRTFLTGKGKGEGKGKGKGKGDVVKRAVALPKDFQITDVMRAWAKKNAASVSVDLQTEKFKNHALANGRTMKDWSAGWRNWMLKAVEFASRDGVGSAGQSQGVDDDWMRENGVEIDR